MQWSKHLLPKVREKYTDIFCHPVFHHVQLLNNNVWNSNGTAVILYLCHLEEVLTYVQL